jgi:hypothetical protein
MLTRSANGETRRLGSSKTKAYVAYAHMRPVAPTQLGLYPGEESDTRVKRIKHLSLQYFRLHDVPTLPMVGTCGRSNEVTCPNAR